jgi:TRAP-type C4-dicarboxylate transport system substrate-binding protein
MKKPDMTTSGRLASTGRRSALMASALAVAVMALGPGTAAAQTDELQPVVVRLVADHPPAPHPAALSQAHFQKRLPEVIPGSEVRIYHAGALYTIPEALEAMSVGDLEMTWGQFGKTAAADRWMNVVAGPMLVTTPAAMEQFDEFETVKMLKERFAEMHDVKVLGTAHMSMYMGAGAGERLKSAEDFSGRKIRSMGPPENAALSAWGASPVTMAFGDVPPALQTGVLDGLLTSLGGWNSVRDQAPYFTVAGVNGIVGDYYWIGASQSWWDSLNEPTQQAIESLLVDEVLPLQAQINYCNDKRLLDRFGTEDPEEPGIYILSDEEREALAEDLGNATVDWVKENSPEEAHEWVDRFVEEARAASAAHPMGTSEMEKTDCSTLAHLFPEN